ncbi:MAG: hypothetical protein ACK5XN_40535 [Bacteroidota bacterium]
MRNISLKAHQFAARFARIGTVYNRLLQRIELFIEDNGGNPTGRQIWMAYFTVVAIIGLCFANAIWNNQPVASLLGKGQQLGAMVVVAMLTLVGILLGYFAHEKSIVTRNPITGKLKVHLLGVIALIGLLTYCGVGYMLHESANNKNSEFSVEPAAGAGSSSVNVNEILNQSDSGSAMRSGSEGGDNANALKFLALMFAALEIVVGFVGFKPMINAFHYQLLNRRIKAKRRQLDQAAANCYKYDLQYKDMVMATEPEKAELRLAEHASDRVEQALAYHLGQTLRTEVAKEDSNATTTRVTSESAAETEPNPAPKTDPDPSDVTPSPVAPAQEIARAEEQIADILKEDPTDNLKF